MSELASKNKTKTYSAYKTAELGHPNANGILNKTIKLVLDRYEHGSSEVHSFKQLYSDVYDSLWKQPEFSEHCIYKFKYEFPYLDVKERIATTKSLLLLLIVSNEPELLQRILTNCNPNLMAHIDSAGNNALHLAAFYGQHRLLCVLLEYSKTKPYFDQLMNARNNEGTNPLGMYFLNPVRSLQEEKILECFIYNQSFEINSYLNNKIGMDVYAPLCFRRLGGMNCLHLSLKEKQMIILHMLVERNRRLAVVIYIDAMVNFRYPAMNPDHHMWSPAKFASLIKTTGGEESREILVAYQAIIKKLTEDGSDDSGDSDDEDTPAWHYNKEDWKI